MKKVLIITYYWPPSGGGGVQRWVKFVKYLRKYNWEPIVFTPENPEIPSYDESLIKDIPHDITILKNKIWEPYSFYKKFTGKNKKDRIQTAFLSEKKTKSSFLENMSVWIRGNLFIPDARRYWIAPSVRFIRNYMASNKIDAVITTGPPHSTHLIGIKLKNHTGIPWLADFRDPWTNIDFYHDLKLSKFADRLHHKLEKKVLKEADAVSVISPGMVTDFSKIYARKYHIIPNGFDEDDIRNIEVTKTKKFSLAHIGSLTKSRNPENLWKAISILIEKTPGFSKDIEILIIGKIDISAIESLRKYNLEQYLRQIDYMPHDEVIAEQKKASLLLLLINNTPSAKLILTGKIFEYLISNTPIICIGPNDGDAAKVVIDTNSGSVYDFNNESELLSGIAGYYNHYKQGNLVSKSNNLEKYERKRLTGEMSSLLDSMT